MTDLTIAAVLEHYGADLTRVASYGWRPVKCPFHDDRIASASVNLESDVFVCHACEIKGNAVQVICRVENLDYKGAVAYAERNIGASISGIRQATKANTRSGARSLWDKSILDGPRD